MKNQISSLLPNSVYVLHGHFISDDNHNHSRYASHLQDNSKYRKGHQNLNRDKSNDTLFVHIAYIYQMYLSCSLRISPHWAYKRSFLKVSLLISVIYILKEFFIYTKPFFRTEPTFFHG
jgi:hypothetical protein